MPGKRVQFDDETWAAVDMLARDRMADFQELADEAFNDLLKKHGRPVGLKDQLRKSVQAGDEPKSRARRQDSAIRSKSKDGASQQVAADAGDPGRSASRAPSPPRQKRQVRRRAR